MSRTYSIFGQLSKSETDCSSHFCTPISEFFPENPRELTALLREWISVRMGNLKTLGYFFMKLPIEWKYFMNPHRAYPITPAAIFSSLWRNHYLIWQMVKRDIMQRYRGSLMGIL